VNDARDLDQQIKQKLATAEDRWQIREKERQQRVHEHLCLHKHYTTIADRLVRTVVRPRMEALARHFPNAAFPEAPNGAGHHCVLSFGRTARFPAAARLELAVSRDGRIQYVIGEYRLEIVPVPFPFPSREEVRQPIDALDEERLAAWFDEKVLDFVDTYLRLADTSPSGA
jgi:hypothetical protein